MWPVKLFSNKSSNWYKIDRLSSLPGWNNLKGGRSVSVKRSQATDSDLLHFIVFKILLPH